MTAKADIPTRSIVTLLLLALSSAAWVSHLHARRTSAARERVVAQVKYQHLAAGITIPLDSLSHTETSVSARVGYLLFVTSDTCPFTRDDLPYWKRVLDVAPSSVKVWILPKQGDSIASELYRYAVALDLDAAVARPDNMPLFIAFTGLRGTPATLFLDEAARVRLLAWRMSERTIRVFIDEFDRHAPELAVRNPELPLPGP